MKKRIQILTLTLVFTLSLCACSNVFATSSASPGKGSSAENEKITSGSSSSNGKGSSTGSGITTSEGSSSNGKGSSVESGMITSGGSPSSEKGSSAESGMITSGSSSSNDKGSSTENGKNDRPSTGIQLTGKDKQTSTPSGSVNPDDYKPNELTTSDAGEFINIANSIIAAIRMFGTVVAVVALMALGVKYMLGSTQDKASYKESMIPYLVGAVMVFAIPNIIGIIFDLVTQIKF